jgi:hypothetical protein
MIKNHTYYLKISILEKLYVLTFLLLFLNVSLINQYLDFQDFGNSIIELCEDEEGEEKEVNEEIDEDFFEFHTSFLGFNEDELLNFKSVRNISILIANHIDVYTPPPELR